MSDDQPPLGPSAGEGPEDGQTSGPAAVPAGPLRPTGKRSRRTAAEPAGSAVAVAGDSGPDDSDDAGSEDKPAKRTKPAKAAKTDEGRGNPFQFVWNYLKQVIGELRKVIWPNRKQMVTYTTVVLVFLTFMVTLIGFTDLGLAKLVAIIFG